MSAISVVAGIDVAKAHVDVDVVGVECAAQRFDNEADGHSAVASVLKALGVGLVVMEATGGYEASLACALQGAGLVVAVVNPAQPRKFANPRVTGQRLTASTPECWPSSARRWPGDQTWIASCAR